MKPDLVEQPPPNPQPLAPMLATPGGLPAAQEKYAFEFKWDGVRCLLHKRGGVVSLHGRTGVDISSTYPELGQAAAALDPDEVVLDGEIVALDSQQRPSFSLLQKRLQSSRPPRRLVARVPITYFAFDVLELDARSLLDKPYRQRRRHLEALNFHGPHWATPPSQRGSGSAVLETSRGHGLEGVVAKLLDSPYRAGKRSRDWIKIKNRQRQEFVIGGWTEGHGARATSFGALLLGTYEGAARARRLVYAGRVGTGFDDSMMRRLERALRRLERPDSPFSDDVGLGPVHFVVPELVAEVSFAEWTPGGMLRQPSFHGLRSDKSPRDVHREDRTEGGA